MRILVLNSGSSSVKFELVRVSGAESGPIKRLASGIVERIGPSASIHAEASGLKTEPRPASAEDHRGAVVAIFDWLRALPEGHPAAGTVDGVGHRVVHGGSWFVAPTRLTPEVVKELEPLSELAPLHNPGALQGIRAAMEFLGPDVPMVAVFDTAFHAKLPPVAATYALPQALTERFGIRRYGFHGLAHQWMLLRYAELTGQPTEACKLVTLQLGNGCSAAATAGGRSVDTSMGFTPLEGLVMGTRAGDLDPGVITYLQRKSGMSSDELERCLNQQSGLLGVSGLSSDMRDLLQAAESDPRATLAVELFCYRIQKYIGAYLAALDGAEAVLFGGGIGEHAPEIRRRVCAGMEWCGLRLDPARNSVAMGKEGRITAADSTFHAYVISVDEEALIARQTAECIQRGN